MSRIPQPKPDAMPLHQIPVIVPYRLDDDADGVQYTISVQAVGTQPPAAQAVAQVLVRALAQIRHGDHPIKLIADRIQVGHPTGEINGPYAYVLAHGAQIGLLNFPARIDQDHGQLVGQMLEGLDSKQVHGVLFDAIHLTYINSLGLAALAGHATRLNLRLFRASNPIAKVIEITGLTRQIPMYPDLPSALGELVRKGRLVLNGG
jgi:anti-anti-sigma factor